MRNSKQRTMRIIRVKQAVRYEKLVAENLKMAKKFDKNCDCSKYGCSRCVACGHCTKLDVEECNALMKIAMKEGALK